MVDAETPGFTVTVDGPLEFTRVLVEGYFLTVDVVGNGTVTLDPAQPVDGYTAGTYVDLTATPDSGWLFDGWSGALSGDTNPETVVIPVQSAIVAEFRQVQTIDLEIVGTGAHSDESDRVIRRKAIACSEGK